MSEWINHDNMDFIAEILDSSDQKDLKREQEVQSTDTATARTVVHLRTRGSLDPSSTRSAATTTAAATAVTVPKAKLSAKSATKSASTAKKSRRSPFTNQRGLTSQ